MKEFLYAVEKEPWNIGNYYFRLELSIVSKFRFDYSLIVIDIAALPIFTGLAISKFSKMHSYKLSQFTLPNMFLLVIFSEFKWINFIPAEIIRKPTIFWQLQGI